MKTNILRIMLLLCLCVGVAFSPDGRIGLGMNLYSEEEEYEWEDEDWEFQYTTGNATVTGYYNDDGGAPGEYWANLLSSDPNCCGDGGGGYGGGSSALGGNGGSSMSFADFQAGVAQIVKTAHANSRISNVEITRKKLYGAMDGKGNRPQIGWVYDPLDENSNGILDSTEDLNQNGKNDFDEQREKEEFEKELLEQQAQQAREAAEAAAESAAEKEEDFDKQQQEENEDNDSGTRDDALSGNDVVPDEPQAEKTPVKIEKIPCDSATTAQGEAVSEMFNEPGIKEKFDSLSQKAQTEGAGEYGFLVTKNSEGVYASTELTGGKENSYGNALVSINTPDVVAEAHNHTSDGYSSFSARDFTALAEINSYQKDYTTIFVAGMEGTYAMVLDDPRAAQDFVVTYGNLIDRNNRFYSGTEPQNKYIEAYWALAEQKFDDEADAFAKAYMYEQMNMGISLFRAEKDENGISPLRV